MLFWPTAVVFDKHERKVYSLYATTGSSTLEEAKEYIKGLKNDNDRYSVLCAYVDTGKIDDVVYLENNIDALGYVRYQNDEEKEHHV